MAYDLLVLEETADRANDSDINGSLTSDGNATWTVIAGTAEIVSNKIKQTSGTLKLASLDDMSTIADFAIEAYMDPDAGLMLRYDGATDDYVLAYQHPIAGLRVYNVVAGTRGGNLCDYSGATGSTLYRFELTGDQLTVYFDGAGQGTVTVSRTAAGVIGLSGREFGGGFGDPTWDTIRVYAWTDPSGGGGGLINGGLINGGLVD